VDLIRVIDGLLADMQQRGAHWKGFLDKLAVINMAHHQVCWVLVNTPPKALLVCCPAAQGQGTQPLNNPTPPGDYALTHTQIMVELRPLLRQYTVYPKFVDNPGIENGVSLLNSILYPGFGIQQQEEPQQQHKQEQPSSNSFSSSSSGCDCPTWLLLVCLCVLPLLLQLCLICWRAGCCLNRLSRRQPGRQLCQAACSSWPHSQGRPWTMQTTRWGVVGGRTGAGDRLCYCMAPISLQALAPCSCLKMHPRHTLHAVTAPMPAAP
jgi:hypothetical protein